LITFIDHRQIASFGDLTCFRSRATGNGAAGSQGRCPINNVSIAKKGARQHSVRRKDRDLARPRSMDGTSQSFLSRKP
jgi:hypothetical protein